MQGSEEGAHQITLISDIQTSSKWQTWKGIEELIKLGWERGTEI